ncbi:hypothetical protein [Kurthia gibsonii]|uniref:hypothetical protein n=1 Tax=Kurthia gibsonii TaxID=33946 RepID=UPI001141DF60|nr:hypothetical protein [Kurthia gibsonii]GED19575.1 hypothetical protein KGI01_13160 [Kurthia gibsonii]
MLILLILSIIALIGIPLLLVISSLKFEERQLDAMIHQYYVEHRTVRKTQKMSVKPVVEKQTQQKRPSAKDKSKRAFTHTIRKKLPGYIYPSREAMIRDRANKN